MGQWVRPVRTPAAPLDVSRGYAKSLRRMLGSVAPITVAILHAHGSLETGNFDACICNGPGNIKASAKWTGLYTTIKLNERLERGGKKVYVWYDPILGELLGKDGPARYPEKPNANPPGHPQCRMRAFPTLADGIENKTEFLGKPHWRPVLDFAIAGDAVGYVHGLHERTYFTAAEEPYRRGVVSLTKKLLPLAERSAVEPIAISLEEEEQLCLDMAECMRLEIPEWLKRQVAQITALTAQQAYDDDAEARRRARDAAIRGGNE